jgi:preprotein translocase subunit SecG
MCGQLILRDRGGDIMKKSNLYFIYGLLFAIISNVADNRLMIGLTAIFAVVFMITSLALGYLEDKYK